MKVTLQINGVDQDWEAAPGESLLSLLRRQGFFGAKDGGCAYGECGACAVLLDGRPVNSCLVLAPQAEGHRIQTIESLGEHPEGGWKKTEGLHAIQMAFVESGAIQCGYCTPAMVLAAQALLEKTPDPSEEQVRTALSGVLCRCTGYLKPVQAVLRAAARLRGETVEPLQGGRKKDEGGEQIPLPAEWLPAPSSDLDEGRGQPAQADVLTRSGVLPRVWTTPQTAAWAHVGQPEPKVDAVKLVQGKPAFTADIEMRGMLVAKVLHSPVAHARIRRIDASQARALPGVAAVLTWQDIPRVVYSTAGQSDPIPGPLDAFSLDNKVRFVGDRVAFVAAETEEIAEQALKLIEVEYEPLPLLLDPGQAMQPGAPVCTMSRNTSILPTRIPARNLAAEIRIDIGDVEKGFTEADRIFEGDYEVPKVQQAHIEPHVAVTYWDEDDRLVIRTSTQVPFHVRRILAPVLGLPVKRIRVIKPRIGGGFGGKQEILIEDVAAHLTIATGRPVIYEYTREEEFIAARSRHPMRVRMKTGVKLDGTITANAMYVLSRYRRLWLPCPDRDRQHRTQSHGAVCWRWPIPQSSQYPFLCGCGLYQPPTCRGIPRLRCAAGVLAGRTPHGEDRPRAGPGSDRVPLEECHPCRRAASLQHSLERRPRASARNHPYRRIGGVRPPGQGSHRLGSRNSPTPEWHTVPGKPHLRRGIGVAMVMQGTAIPYLDMGGASIKMNDDGSFNLLVGATDLGTGSDTVLAQMAAEVLGVPLEDMIVYSSDTDFTPFDKGAYASSTTYISGTAVVKAAQQVAERIRLRAARMLQERGRPGAAR